MVGVVNGVGLTGCESTNCTFNNDVCKVSPSIEDKPFGHNPNDGLVTDPGHGTSGTGDDEKKVDVSREEVVVHR